MALYKSTWYILLAAAAAAALPVIIIRNRSRIIIDLEQFLHVD